MSMVGGQLWEEPPLPILLLFEWASNTLPTSARPCSCKKKTTQTVFLFLPPPMKSPAAELQLWPAASTLGGTAGLCRALGEPWPLWLEQDPHVCWQRCSSSQAWCRGWVLLNAALSRNASPAAKSTAQARQHFSSSPARKSVSLRSAPAPSAPSSCCQAPR